MDTSTEDKIKQAAQKLFTKKGYSATKTREIAEEAGINLALLNYYFRSKERLFDMIMRESMKQFVSGITTIINDEQTDYTEKFRLLVHSYIDLLISQPELPLFVLSEIRNNPEDLVKWLNIESIITNSFFVKQLLDAMRAGEIALLNPMHLLMNTVGLTVFPFIGSPLLKKAGGISDDVFNDLMLERKELIPKWINYFLRPES